MEVDVSDYATEGVLSMEYKDGKQRPVVFFLKSLNKIVMTLGPRVKTKDYSCIK